MDIAELYIEAGDLGAAWDELTSVREAANSEEDRSLIIKIESLMDKIERLNE